jgi:hypothetical protein
MLSDAATLSAGKATKIHQSLSATDSKATVIGPVPLYVASSRLIDFLAVGFVSGIRQILGVPETETSQQESSERRQRMRTSAAHRVCLLPSSVQAGKTATYNSDPIFCNTQDRCERRAGDMRQIAAIMNYEPCIRSECHTEGVT